MKPLSHIYIYEVYLRNAHYINNTYTEHAFTHYDPSPPVFLRPPYQPIPPLRNSFLNLFSLQTPHPFPRCVYI